MAGPHHSKNTFFKEGMSTLKEATKMTLELLQGSTYIDMHSWVFTPGIGSSHACRILEQTNVQREKQWTSEVM